MCDLYVFRILTMVWAVVGMLPTSIHANIRICVYMMAYNAYLYIYIIFDGTYEREKKIILHNKRSLGWMLID